MKIDQRSGAKPSYQSWGETRLPGDRHFGKCRLPLFAWSLIAFLLPTALAGSGLAGRSAQHPASTIDLQVRIGLAGYARRGNWVPLAITVSNYGPDQTVEIFVAGPVAGQASVDRAPEQTVFVETLPAGSRKRFSYAVLETSGYSGRLVVGVRQADQILAREEANFALLADDQALFGVLGQPMSQATNQAIDQAIDQSSGRVQQLSSQPLWATLAAQDLPPSPPGWQALTGLLVHDFDGTTLSLEQTAALRAWVTAGGELLVFGGSGAARSVDGLEDLVPFQPTGTVTLQAGEGAILVTTGQPKPGAEVDGQGILLSVRRRYGNGRVSFFTSDALLPRISAAQPSAFALQPSSPLYLDLAQAVLAEGQINPLPPPAGWLLGLTAYLLLIGPVPYFLLRPWQRLSWAWWVIPGIAVAFTGLIFLTGLRPAPFGLTIRRWAIVHVPPAGQPSRSAVEKPAAQALPAQVDLFLDIFSLRQLEVAVHLPAGAVVSRITTGSSSPIGSERGQRPAPLTIQNGDGSLAARQSVSILVTPSSDHGLYARLILPDPGLTSQVEFDLPTGAAAQATIQLYSQRSESLDNVFFALDHQVVQLPRLAPHSSITYTQALPQPASLRRGLADCVRGLPVTQPSQVTGFARLLTLPSLPTLGDLSASSALISGAHPPLLVALSSTAPVDSEVTLPGAWRWPWTALERNRTVYLIHPQIGLRQSDLYEVPSALASWRVVTGTVAPPPAPLKLISGSLQPVVLQYQTDPVLPVGSPVTITLSLQATRPPVLELWNLQARTWDRISLVESQTPNFDVRLAHPAQYFDALGRLTLRLSAAGLGDICVGDLKLQVVLHREPGA